MRLAAAVERSRRRFLTVRTVEAFAGTGSGMARRRAVESAIAAGLLPGSAPTAEAIRLLVKRHRAGDTTIESFADLPRTGRTKIVPDTRLLSIVSHAATTQRPSSIREVHRLVVVAASKAGICAPSYGTVKQWYQNQGALSASAARHGAEAAEIDGLPHSTVPATHTHDVWTLDEWEFPVWVRLYDASSKSWVSRKLTVVTIMDNCSRAIVACWLCDPARVIGRKND